jgi:O-antigen/teichoic acid export membrane protein
MNNTSTVLVARGETRLQAWLGVAAAALNLALSIWLVQRIGAEGVILGTIASYLIVLILPQTALALGVLRGKAPARESQA